MAGEKKVEEEVAQFMVVQGPGFFDGLNLHPPGSVIYWKVPENWNTDTHGKHHAHWDPAPSFRPMNEAAEKLLADMKKRAEKK